MVVVVVITIMLSARQNANERQAKRRTKVNEEDPLYQVHLKKERNRRAEAREAMSPFQLEECHVIEWAAC